MHNIVFERDKEEKSIWQVINCHQQRTVVAEITLVGDLPLIKFLPIPFNMPLSALETIAYGIRLIKNGNYAKHMHGTTAGGLGKKEFFTVDYKETVEFEQIIGEMVRKCKDEELYPFLKGVRMMMVPPPDGSFRLPTDE